MSELGNNNPDSIVEQYRQDVMKPSMGPKPPSTVSAWTYPENTDGLPPNGADPGLVGLTFPKDNVALK